MSFLFCLERLSVFLGRLAKVRMGVSEIYHTSEGTNKLRIKLPVRLTCEESCGRCDLHARPESALRDGSLPGGQSLRHEKNPMARDEHFDFYHRSCAER